MNDLAEIDAGIGQFVKIYGVQGTKEFSSCTSQIVNLNATAGFQTVVNNVIPSIVMR